ALVADHHRLRDILVRLDFVLDRLWSDLLAAGGRDNVFLAIGDAQEAILELADITRVEPTLGIYRFGRRVRFVVIALHDVRSTRADLAIARDHHLDARHRLADSSNAERRWRVHRDHWRRLREAVPFEDHEAGGVKEL